MATTPVFHVLPDLNSGPRAFITTDEDHGGIALVIYTVMATWVVMCLMIRVWTRSTVSGPFGLDDWVCCVATIFGVVQVIVSAVAVSYGFGKKTVLLTEAQTISASKAIYAAQLLYIVTNALTKCTVSLLLARIVFLRDKVYACYGVLMLSILWGIGSFIAEAVRCTEAAPWALVGVSCADLYLGWQVITALNIFIELLLLAIPVWIVWSLQTTSSKKLVVIAIFWLRAPVIVAAGIRLHYLEPTYNTEPLFRAVIPFTLLNIEMHYGLMASTFPTLKPFVRAFNTGFGAYDASTYGEGSGREPSYVLQSLEKKQKRRSRLMTVDVSTTQYSDFGIEPINASGWMGKSTTHVSAATRAMSGESSDSQRMIIHQTLAAEAHYENSEAVDSGDQMSTRGRSALGKELI